MQYPLLLRPRWRRQPPRRRREQLLAWFRLFRRWGPWDMLRERAWLAVIALMSPASAGVAAAAVTAVVVVQVTTPDAQVVATEVPVVVREQVFVTEVRTAPGRPAPLPAPESVELTDRNLDWIAATCTAYALADQQSRMLEARSRIGEIVRTYRSNHPAALAANMRELELWLACSH